MLINQLGTPGLGTSIAGRFWVGLCQLLLTLAGFGLVVTWFVLQMVQLYRQMGDNFGSPKPVGWIGATGGLLFVIAWIWSMFTSFDMLRKAGKRPEGPQPPPLL